MRGSVVLPVTVPKFVVGVSSRVAAVNVYAAVFSAEKFARLVTLKASKIRRSLTRSLPSVLGLRPVRAGAPKRWLRHRGGTTVSGGDVRRRAA